MKKSIRKVIFPVGGMGTRFLPATKSMPKEMLTVVDKPVVQYAVEEAWSAGIEGCIFVTGRGKSAIEDHFDYSYELNDVLAKKGKHDILERLGRHVPKAGQMVYIRQQEPLGLGHAVWCARNLIGDEPFVVSLADDLVLSDHSSLEQMVTAYNTVGGNIVALAEVPREHTYMYGIVDVESRDGDVIKVRGIVEKPQPQDAPSCFAVIGRYILQPEIFQHLEKQQRGAGNEIQLTDAMAELLKEQSFHGVVIKGKRFDCGSRAGFIEANVAFALSRNDINQDLRKILRPYLEEVQKADQQKVQASAHLRVV